MKIEELLISSKEKLEHNDCLEWDNFVRNYEFSDVYQLPVWNELIKKTYKHKSYYLIAKNTNPIYFRNNKHNRLVGALSLVIINNFLVGNTLISMPYFDTGGIINKCEIVEKALLYKTIGLAEYLGSSSIELRQTYQLSSIKNQLDLDILDGWNLSIIKNKVRMIFHIPENQEVLIKSFNSKLRNQIRKPIREGLTVKIGGAEFIDDFYNIFAENMRDLGSPVHSKKFIAEALNAFPNTANVFIVYGNKKPLAGSVTIGFKDTLSNPWASSLRRYSHLAPNMLLYWSMLEFACQQGYKRFDFGRSTLGEGTYKFKEQWGAKPEPLYWYRLSKTNDQNWGGQPDKDKMSRAIEYWKKLPVPLTKIIGPKIRKYISL